MYKLVSFFFRHGYYGRTDRPDKIHPRQSESDDAIVFASILRKLQLSCEDHITIHLLSVEEDSPLLSLTVELEEVSFFENDVGSRPTGCRGGGGRGEEGGWVR